MAQNMPEKNHIIYQASNDTGDMILTEYQVFPGIKLIYQDIHMLRYEYPAQEEKQILEIHHCREGRYEYQMGKQYYYLASGDLSVSRSGETTTESRSVNQWKQRIFC